jgi:hypothetical protein
LRGATCANFAKRQQKCGVSEALGTTLGRPKDSSRESLAGAEFDVGFAPDVLENFAEIFQATGRTHDVGMHNRAMMRAPSRSSSGARSAIAELAMRLVGSTRFSPD